MGIAREDTIPPVHGSPAIRIVTMSNGSVVLEQGEKAISLHAYQAAEIAGFLWPAAPDGRPQFEDGSGGGQPRRRLQ